ncbi:MAG TPA: phosphoglycerol geranylgeranyltransferase [Methanospirillum sp.]|uniref:phosphoglycerol geranylgeranyltransferase n=1 Tax=Methanospirillum sp. TaxID=45200 RepID=UPI002D1C526A|nr:phosphoglycerol geranylgeranyltransferase [Methanospirillum sp.]HWQ63846.1 phosphoglycerol geranylgeranyltransferase [Methanospirillum sp.]
MYTKWKTWAHVTKLDPDKNLTEDQLAEIATSGTDALMLSGTLNITKENMQELRDQVREYGLPLVVEPAGPEAVVADGIDLLFIASVMNTNQAQWIVGKHKEWALHSKVQWDRVIQEAYIVLNPNSSVARVTGSDCSIGADEVAAYAEVADHFFQFPVVYIEYSGTYGSPEIVKAAAGAIDNAVLYYGGGIDSGEKAAEMAQYADTIVVGNAVYDKGVQTLIETVQAIQ